MDRIKGNKDGNTQGWYKWPHAQGAVTRRSCLLRAAARRPGLAGKELGGIGPPLSPPARSAPPPLEGKERARLMLPSEVTPAQS